MRGDTAKFFAWPEIKVIYRYSLYMLVNSWYVYIYSTTPPTDVTQG